MRKSIHTVLIVIKIDLNPTSQFSKMDKTDTVPGNQIEIGKYYSHKGKYMGKYLSFKLVGRAYDPDPEYTFEKGAVADLGLMFTEVEKKPLVDGK